MPETEKKVKKEYGDQSIKSLKGADRVRKRPAVIFGSDGLEGCEHSFFEILSNSVDEAREGHGDVITVTRFQDGSLSVEDRGRGVPLGWNAREKQWNWHLIYNELYAGGKYDNNDGGNAYTYSLGLNGLGAAATQYSSEYMEVYSCDGVNESHVSFKKGNPVAPAEEMLSVRPLEKNERRTGTKVIWKPDIKVFTDTAIPVEHIKDVLHRQSIVNPGIKFILRAETGKNRFEESKYYYEKGIEDYVAEHTKNDSVTEPVLWNLETSGKDREDQKEYKLKAEFAFCLTKNTPKLEYYHNSSFLEHGGSPDKAAQTAFVYSLDRYLKNAGKYKKDESRIKFEDIAESLCLVISSFSTQTSYENQTKKAITNVFIRDAMTEFLKKQLDFYFVENPVAAEQFANQILINKRSRESAERERVKIKTEIGKAVDMANQVEKFVSCRSKDPNVRELYIVEGDSALTSCKLGRSAEFQAIIPVRGKTLNCMKASYDRIFKSDVITDLLRVIGCGVELKEKVKSDIPPFKLENLNWSKIIICTDADEDGFQIRTLLLTLFYRLLPTLLAETKVFIAESPLFEISCKDQIHFAYNEFEKAEILKKLEGQKYTLQRSKGLGENEPEMMWQTTMNPATRRLIAVTPADAAATEEIFDVLLGDNLPARKDFIALHGSEYVKDADI